MAFDPDKYLEENTPAAGFNPDAYLAAQGTTESKPLYEKINNAVFTGARHLPILGTAFNPAVQDAALRGLDYLAGGTRTGIAGAAGLADREDFLKALKGRAPRSSEYLSRSSLPEGPSIPLTSISARDAAGFAADIATDPLTYVSPLNEVAGFGKATSAAGKSMYKSGLKRVDEQVAKYGKEPVSDLLMKERVTGSARSIAKQMDELAAKRLADRQAILEAATNKGAQVNIEQAMTVPQEFVDKLQAVNNPEQVEAIALLNDRINTYLDRAQYPMVPPTPVQASAWKSSAANRVGDRNWEIMSISPEGKRFEKSLARGLKIATEDAVEQTSGKKAADTLRQKNDELGRLLTSQDVADQAARVEGRKNAFTSVDGMLLGAGVVGETGGHHGGLGALALKKLADAFKESRFRTNAGLALQDLGQTPIPDSVLRRAIINQSNPWQDLK